MGTEALLKRVGLRRIALLAGSAALLLAGLLVWVWFNPTLSAQAEGTIVTIRTTAQNSECCPVTVEFTDHFGTTHTFSNPSGGNRQQRVGDTIGVYYDPNDPSQAQTAKDRITPIAVGGFGVFVLAMIAVMFLMGSRRERRSETPSRTSHLCPTGHSRPQKQAAHKCRYVPCRLSFWS